MRNSSADSTVPDLAAATTAIATGTKVANGRLAVDAEDHPLTNLLELARETGRMTGLITNGRLTSSTSAAFYGHTATPNKWEDIARQLVEAGDLDLILGGGAADFLPLSQGGRRSDDADLLKIAGDNGYDLSRTLTELEEVPLWRRAKLFGLFSDAELSFAEDNDASKDQPTLADMVRRGIELLQYHRGGYLLVIDTALIRKATHDKRRDVAIAEAIELDRAVAAAVEYAGAKSAIFVCNDVALPDDAVPLPSPGAESQVSGEQSTSNESITPGPSMPEASSVPSPSPFPLATPSPTPASTMPEDVLVFGTGLGAESVHGVIDNTTLFEILRDNL
jgi:alkaline phosphatase